eukprot:1071908-Rhodomonas_salina.1
MCIVFFFGPALLSHTRSRGSVSPVWLIRAVNDQVYLSVLWKSVRAFAVETAGSFDRDCELAVHTSIDSMRTIGMDLRATTCDIMAVQRFFSDKILGLDNRPALMGLDRLEGQSDAGGGSFAAWL